MLFRVLLLVISIICLTPSQAQPGRTTLLAPHIKTLRMIVDDDVERFPVIRLGSDDRLEVSFDDLTHEYKRYTYRIEHCNYDGTVSQDLFESDYVSAVAEDEVIEEYTPSTNTMVAYTHYSFTLPNAHVRPTLSGNYRLTVSTENEDGELSPVIQTYFGVVDTKVSVQATCTGNTEVDRYGSNQQLSLRIDCGQLILRDAATELKTVVMQNRRFDNMVTAPPPTSQMGNVLLWEHDRSLIFEAGNEYRKMEMLSTRYPGMHGESMRWHDPYYHYTLVTDEPRRHYLYDEDRDGLSVVRCEGAGDPDTEADYAIVHFTLDAPLTADYDFYVNGRWATTGLTSDTKLVYDPDAGVYRASLLLKLGYYNYLYLAVPRQASASASDSQGVTRIVEGDYWQTENEYEILAYYRPAGGRYWQLVACATPIYRQPR